MGVADIAGMVQGACEIIERKVNDDDDDPTRGTVDADRFVLWVQEKLIPSLGSRARGEPRSIVAMDNASTHLDSRVRELIEAAGASLIYTAPFSPDLMPIEFCFRQYKAFLRKNIHLFGRKNWAALHHGALTCITHANMCGYYRKVGCIRNVPQAGVINIKDQEAVTFAATVAVLAASIQESNSESDSSEDGI
jgi:hypothetical protein